MLLSREKINHLSKKILRYILSDDRVEFFCEENELRLKVVNILQSELELENDIDSSVRNALYSYSKDIKEGTEEWDILYHKHYVEENKRRRNITY